MHVVIIAGLSKTRGDQLSLKHDYVLTRDGMVMTYNNLRSHFGVPPVDHALSDYSTPYRAGIHLFNCLRAEGVECTLINFLDTEWGIFEEAARANPDVVAISTSFLINIRAVKGVTEIVRRHTPRTKIVVGGPLVFNSYLLYQMQNTDYHLDPCRQDYFFLNQERRNHEDIDYFVAEEQGEKSFVRLIRALDSGKDPADVPNLAFYRNGDIVFTAREAEQNDFSNDLIDWAQMPARHLHPIYPVRGSRGCPYRCKFCNFATHRHFSIKPHDVLVSELTALSSTGRVNIVRFTDDNLFLNRRNIDLLCKAIATAGGGMKWTSFIRADVITDETVKLLKESGCLLAQIGMESGDAAMLARMNKTEDPDCYLKAVELLNAHGIYTQLYFIVGYPGETTETIDNTLRLIHQFKHDGPAANFIMVFPFILAPLSPVYAPENRAAFELTGYMSDWRHATMDSRQAVRHAREMLLHIDNIYPFYGIEELAILDAGTIKNLSRMRLSLRKAEMMNAPDAQVDQMWNDLRALVTGPSRGR